MQEDRLGKLPGGSRGVNSGRIWRFKRDGRIHDYLIEARDTESGSYRIEKAEFRQMENDAMATPPGLRPAMQIHMDDMRLMVTFEQDWLDLYEEVLKLREFVESQK